MEEFKQIAAKALTSSEQTLYTDTKGAIVKTILLYNSKEQETEATLSLDGVAFKFKLLAGETQVISTPILSKTIKGTGDGINIHITGLQL